jgi:hypothetical protein
LKLDGADDFSVRHDGKGGADLINPVVFLCNQFLLRVKDGNACPQDLIKMLFSSVRFS